MNRPNFLLTLFAIVLLSASNAMATVDDDGLPADYPIGMPDPNIPTAPIAVPVTLPGVSGTIQIDPLNPVALPLPLPGLPMPATIAIPTITLSPNCLDVAYQREQMCKVTAEMAKWYCQSVPETAPFQQAGCLAKALVNYNDCITDSRNKYFLCYYP